MKRLPKEEKAGLYLTIIVHLGALIVILLIGLERNLRKDEDKYVLDFSEYEKIERLAQEKERLEKEVQMKEEISRRIEEKLADSPSSARSIAVNRSQLKDDRGTDAEKLYDDAERLRKELAGGYEVPTEEDDIATTASKPEKKQKAVQYSGPSVLDWYLDGRKASRLPIPAYRCLGAGKVKVIITVNPQGTVISAKIDESNSSKDGCLRSFATRAAQSSRFSASTSSPARQEGYIIYQFIAQ